LNQAQAQTHTEHAEHIEYTKTPQTQAKTPILAGNDEQSIAPTEHAYNTDLRQKLVPSLHQIDHDLAVIAEAWPALPEHIRAAILTLTKTGGKP
jgi:hypothetical protein